MQHAKLLHGHVVQFPPIRAEDVFNDLTITNGVFLFKFNKFNNFSGP